MKIRTIVPTALSALLLAACSQSMAGQASMADAKPAPVMVGGQPMYAGKNIVANAVNSADHTTLVAAVKAAGLVQTLEGPGPFTVFAPTNEAFAALPQGTVPTLLEPQNKPTLTKVLTYHVVPGRLTFAALHRMIMEHNGEASLTTVEGGKLMVKMNGPHNIEVIDAKGDVAQISTYDVMQSNGVIQVVDKVLMPG